MATTFKLEFDWNNDGSWTDEATYLITAKLSLGFKGRLMVRRLAEPGQATLVLDNSSQRFSPDYSSGILYGKLLPRRPFRLRATDGVTTWTVWRGFIESISPDAGSYGKRQVTITCVDMLTVLAGQRGSLPLQAGLRADQLITGAINLGLGAPAASATITLAANPADGDTVTINGQAYRFKNTIVSAFDVKIGAANTDTAANLKAAVNTDNGSGTLYLGGTTRLTGITASVATNVVTLAATMPGAIGNSYPLAKSGANITISGAAFTGGADRPAGLTNYRAGNEVYDTAGDQWTGDQTPITRIIEDCVTSEYGAFFVQRDGTLTFYDRRWFFTPLTTALTLDSTSPFVLTLERNMEQVYNSVKTVIHPRATAGAVDVVAQIIKPVRIPPVSGAGAGSATITLHYRDALGNQVGATELVTPLVPYTDFTVKRDPNVYGDDYTVSPLFSFGVLDVRGSEIVIPVYSYETFPLYVNLLNVRGKAITAYDPVVFSADDATSQAAYLKRLLTIDLPLSADALFGNALATYLLDRYKTPFTNLDTVTIRNVDVVGSTNVFSLNLFDVLALTDAQTGLSGMQGYIQGFTLGLDAARFELVWQISRADQQQYWNLGVVGYGELGTNTRLAA